MLRFSQQEMDMLRHYDVTDDHKAVALARLFEDGEKPGATPPEPKAWATRPILLESFFAENYSLRIVRD